jgi:hypothetical protein
LQPDHPDKEWMVIHPIIAMAGRASEAIISSQAYIRYATEIARDMVCQISPLFRQRMLSRLYCPPIFKPGLTVRAFQVMMSVQS